MQRLAQSFCAALLLVLLVPGAAQAYEGANHQFFTFLAAKQFNRCVEGTDIPPLTPLQVRYVARANTGLIDRSVFARMFNWRYYDRADQAEQSMMWVVDTRFHEHFNELSGRLLTVNDPVAAYQDLGRVISYVQLITSPARVVPVYSARFWRFSFGDRFDGFPVDEEALIEAMDGDCGFLDNPPESYEAVLTGIAERTMAAVLAPISGQPAEWTAFWSPSENAGSFGDYGPAGNNFGRRTEFRCGNRERCVLLNDDPLYFEFAQARHIDAVQGTLEAMLLMQRSMRDIIASAP
ncbi:MAG: hypothetical protein AAGE43_09355 [Pseudomonadota bacterium]